jgi:hypothetical protein
LSQSGAAFAIGCVYVFALYFRLMTVMVARASAPLFWRSSFPISIAIMLLGVGAAIGWWRRSGKTQFLLLIVVGLGLSVALFMVQIHPHDP